MLLAMPLVGLVVGYALRDLRRALVVTASIFVVILIVVAVADDGLLDDGGAFFIAADAAVALGLTWLGVALRERRASRGRTA